MLKYQRSFTIKCNYILSPHPPPFPLLFSPYLLSDLTLTAEVEETAPAGSEAVPSITVEDTGSSVVSKKGKKESKALAVKPEKKLPDQGVTMKGNFLRKKPGISRSWEKTHCVLTFQAFYFSGEADTKDYSNMLPIYPNMDAKLEYKKGKGDSPVS